MDTKIVHILIVENDSRHNKATQKAFSACEINSVLHFLSCNPESFNEIANKNFDLAFINSNVFEKECGSLFVARLQKKDKYIPLIYVLDKPDTNFAKSRIAQRASNCISRNFLDADVLYTIINHSLIIRETEITLQNMITENITSSELNFLSEISYQIRTPLNSIIGFSSALMEMEKTEKGLIFLQAIRSSGEKIVQILEDKLGAQIEANEYVLENNMAPVKKIHFNEIVKMKILLVEDNVLNIKLMEHLFSEYGMNADIALNGRIAIDLLEKEEYDLILMDIEMPDMNGYETTKYIREELESNIPIIALTAHAMVGERDKCIAAGMNEYLSKPVDASKLFESIYETLRKSIALQMESVAQFTNLQNLKETMHGKKAAIKEMLGYILVQVPIYLNELNAAVEKTAFDDIAKLAHKIKSAVLIMGAKNLESLLIEIEHKAKSYTDIDRIVALNKEFNESCTKALKEISEEKMKITI
jgi:CheY-like chemotaxis protein